MGFEFKTAGEQKTKSILEILQSENAKEIKQNIELLAADYKRLTGREVCRNCPSDIQYMILTLKHQYKMSQFKFKRDVCHYRINKGDKFTINNGNLTDEKAIEFLRVKPERIELFSIFPSNWKELLDGKIETEEETEERLAIEAEIAEVEKAKENAPELIDKEALLRMPLKELRAKYPEVKATSIEAFVDKVLEL